MCCTTVKLSLVKLLPNPNMATAADENTSSYLLLPLFILSCFSIHFLLSFLRKPSAAVKLPPGPTPIPVVGNLFQLGPKPHQRLAELAATHGPLMALRLGITTTIVVSSSAAARDVFSSNDAALSNRGLFDANAALGHHQLSLIWLHNSPRWRYLRRISNSHLFSGASLDASRHLREKKVAELLSMVENCSHHLLSVDIGEAAFNASLNFMSNTIVSMDMADQSSRRSREFKKLFREVVEATAKPNLADFFPFLRPFDPQGIRRRVAGLFQKFIKLIDSIIDDRISGRSGVPPESEEDILGILLKLSREEDSEMSRSLIAHTLLDLFSASTGSTASTIEFAMAELIRNPKKMKKLREELNVVVGRGNSIREADITRMPYLQAIIKETLRLHPPVPLASRRSIEKDIESQGYTIPKGTRVWVNIWGISRDQRVWTNPISFEPERHIGAGSSFRNSDFELIPFGIGRRSCPGLPLVMRMVPLFLGSLVHTYDWKLEGNVEPESMDMEEVFGVTLEKAIPLRAIPIKV